MRLGVTWPTMDVTDLSAFSGGSFDVVLEKFTLDAVLAEAKDQTTDRRGCRAVSEFHRVVAPDGLLLSIAWGEGKRENLLRSDSLFDVEMSRLPGQATQRPIL